MSMAGNTFKRIVLVGTLLTAFVILLSFNFLQQKKNIVAEDRYSAGHTNVTLPINPELDSSRAAEFYIQEIRVEASEIIIQLAEGLPAEIYALPVYLNKNFENNRLLISRNAHFEEYTFPGPQELVQNKISSKNSQAFIAAFPAQRGNDSFTYKFLYLSDIHNGSIIFRYEVGFKSEKNTAMVWTDFGSFRVAGSWRKK